MYNIMKWIYRENTPVGCGLTRPGYTFLPSFISCVRTRYNGYVDGWSFEEDADLTLTIKGRLLETFPPSGSGNYYVPGYQHPCQEDIGGGHWTKGGKNRETSVLLGIQVFGSEPCGRKSRMLKLINEDPEIKFLEWIKNRICKKWPTEC